MNTVVQPKLTPKNSLEGITLASGWTLVERLLPTIGSSGGNFGAGYKATKDGQIAFVKAIDFVGALNEPDPLLALQNLTSEALFEREVLAYCSDRRMTKVLQYIGHEYVMPPGSTDPFEQVSCLIMEAGSEDLRRLIVSNGLSTCAWNLQVMCDVSEALTQLHRGGVVHQDIKPSNVIREQHNTRGMKVGDLGRVVRKNHSGPFDGYPWPGDPRYWPPEGWYQHRLNDWNDARESMDAYMLASLLVYLYTGLTLQSLVMQYIPMNFRPGVWQGGLDQNLLPVLINAHNRCLEDKLRPSITPQVADAVMAIAHALSHPDPTKRGDKRARTQIGRPVGIDRIHQKLRAASLTCTAIERGQKRQ